MVSSTVTHTKKSKTIGNYRIYIYELQPNELYAVTVCNLQHYYIESNKVFTDYKMALQEFNKCKEELYEAQD